MNVYDEAHTLARALKESPEYLAYAEAKKKVDANPELSGMLNDFQTQQLQLQTAQMLGQQPDADVVAQIQKLSQILMSDPLAGQYLSAQFTLSRVLSDIYGILGEVIQADGFFGQKKN